MTLSLSRRCTETSSSVAEGDPPKQLPSLASVGVSTKPDQEARNEHDIPSAKEPLPSLRASKDEAKARKPIMPSLVADTTAQAISLPKGKRALLFTMDSITDYVEKSSRWWTRWGNLGASCLCIAVTAGLLICHHVAGARVSSVGTRPAWCFTRCRNIRR